MKVANMENIFAYKILHNADYARLVKQGAYSGSQIDIQDGYIHLSLASQLQGTLDKHYTDGADLTLVEVQLAACDDMVKFERSRGGADFPHLYGTLYKTATRRIWPLSAGIDGRYKLPADLEI